MTDGGWRGENVPQVHLTNRDDMRSENELRERQEETWEVRAERERVET